MTEELDFEKDYRAGFDHMTEMANKLLLPHGYIYEEFLLPDRTIQRFWYIVGCDSLSLIYRDDRKNTR